MRLTKSARIFVRAGILLVFITSGLTTHAGPRHVITINDHWEFYQGDLDDPLGAGEVDWERVTLPHTWNADDPFDEVPGYYRGVGWYRKKLDRALFPASNRTFIRFEAANQVAEVYVNGSHAGTHKGGYTAFCFDITALLNAGENWITVQVDNSHDKHIVPLRGDFNFYGGIYRDVHLILTGDVHFDVADHAGPGIFVSTTDVAADTAAVAVHMVLINHGQRTQDIRVDATIFDADGIPRATESWTEKLRSSTRALEKKLEISVAQPHLWSPADPYLYRVECVLADATSEEVLDNVSTPHGIRTFAFHPDSGFTINGQHLKLIGVNRHQDFPGKGNALTTAEHLRDIRMIKEMGANVYRPAHYPQDPAILQACDRLGLLVMMEIPLDHDQTNAPAFFENTTTMMREMIRQYYNHPSIVVWAYMNEMFLGRRLDRDRAQIDSIVAFAQVLENLTREEDPTRYTMIPNHGDFEVYHQSGLTDIPMIVGWNLYNGWYEPDFEGFGEFVDHAHREIPDKPMIITEYGAGTHPRIRSLEPERFDFSLEWENAFHQSHLKQIHERPFIAGSAVWNMFDFGSENRNDAMPYVNNKGLCSFDRKPKDVYYLYKAWLTDPEEPFLQLALNDYPYRFLSGDIHGMARIPMQAYGNTGQAELVVNGISTGVQQLVDHGAVWEIDLGSGPLVLELFDPRLPRTLMDRREIEMQVIGAGNVVEAPVVSCSFGANYFYEEEHSGVIWLPEKAYDDDAWGFVGGEVFNPRNRGVGTDRAIANTPDDPLFQTQRTSVERIVFQVPPGDYEVRMLFAEIQRKNPGERVFDVLVNGETVLKALDLAADYGEFTAAEFAMVTSAAHGRIEVAFSPLAGEAVINAVQVVRQ